MVMNVRESLKSERSVVVDNFSEENNPDDTADICSTSYQAKFKVHVNSHLFVTHRYSMIKVKLVLNRNKFEKSKI